MPVAVERFRFLRKRPKPSRGADRSTPRRELRLPWRRRDARCRGGGRRPGARVWFGLPALLLAAATCAWTCVAIFSAQPVGPFTAVDAPATGAVEFVKGLDFCSSIGAQGLIGTGSAFYVSDWCNATTYEFAATSSPGAPAKLLNHALNGLTDGIALDHGVYFGIADRRQTIVLAGIYTFNPRTLNLGPSIAELPCPNTYGLAADPVSADLYVTGDCGLFRISDPGSPHQHVVQLARGDLDGIAISADGRELWVSLADRDGIEELSSSGDQLAYPTLSQQPVGVALVQPGAPAPPGQASLAGDVLVADTAGNVELIDTHANNTPSIIAAGGNRGAFLITGPDGYAYVAKADQIDQLQPAVFGPVARATPQPEPAATAPAVPTPAASPHAKPAASSGTSLLMIFLIAVGAPLALLLISGLLRALARWRQPRRRDRRDPRDLGDLGNPRDRAGTQSAPGPEVTIEAEQSADPAAGSSAEALPTSQPAAQHVALRTRITRWLDALPGRSSRSSIPEFGVTASGHHARPAAAPKQAALNRIRKAVANPDVLPSATTLRFAVLILAALASTASIYAHLSVLARPNSEAAAVRCVHSLSAAGAVEPATGNADLSCISASVPALARWAAVGVVLLLLVALLVYLFAPWFIRHFTGLRALNPATRSEQALADELDALSLEMGVPADPVWLYAPGSPKQDARAFGHPARPYVVIHGSLRAMLQNTPRNVPGFTAIVTHELAHLRNRDLLPTYATLAVWRAFLSVVLAPYLVSLVAPGIFSEPLHPGAYQLLEVAPDPRITVTSFLLVALVTLSVRAVLRVREAHADATAALYLRDDTALRAIIRARAAQQPRRGRALLPSGTALPSAARGPAGRSGPSDPARRTRHGGAVRAGRRGLARHGQRPVRGRARRAELVRGDGDPALRRRQRPYRHAPGPALRSLGVHRGGGADRVRLRDDLADAPGGRRGRAGECGGEGGGHRSAR
jgi:Zn-dependent protease with chaperone function